MLRTHGVLEGPVTYEANVEAPWCQVASAEGGRIKAPKVPSGLAYEEGCSLPSALGGRADAENEAPKVLRIGQYF